MKKRDLRSEREQHRREENKEYILSASESVFAKKGFSFATMDDIAEGAQFSKATIYHYFKSKKEIFFEIMLKSLDEMNSELERIQKKKTSAAKKLKEIVRFTFDFFERKENIYRIFLMERELMQKFFRFMDEKQKPASSNQDLEYIRKHNIKKKVLVEVIRQTLEEGMQSGEFRRMDVTDTATAFTSLVHGFYFTRFWREKRYDLKDCTNLIHSIFLRGIKKA
ncbi:MAG: TetR/AcrR family transcriptional regulator [Candidatus Aminicenantes bacterium]|nr:MAG: TetR/AcrR family transcriptional regulator [Candidatus Aminicenantes bacterium]